ncbi:MAG: DUF2189 domain-containing protein [Thiohalophilus sp.]|uniref:DUF2189 domain-containing protein n=1 Tax=Thiohalophilus sp. TaxID=3028392 RepID=UPI00286FC696|nr:DUF2189 domain-containing protein [Thiohalophilus sp.]MDR9435378.1 DUF2189 domain-containing protein [Thiohalophilus sp.]
MNSSDSDKNDSPLYAPCRDLMIDAPFGWLQKGWQDFRRAPWHSLIYGAIFAVIGWLLIYLSWTSESYLLVALFICLLVVGPALAFGLYDISQQLEQNHNPSFRHERSKALHEMGHELMLALLLSLMFMFLLILISIVINVVTISGQSAASAAVPLSNTGFLVIAVIFGGLLFGASSFALPMILDQDADAMTAITTSLHAVWANKSALALWAMLVLALTAVGFATALIGFVLIVPVLGYSTWHAYRETIIS